MQGASERKLLIVDGHAYAYRAFHAIRQLASPTGEPTNAIFGFIRMLGKLRPQLAATHEVVIWDGGLAAERVAALPEYKEQRAPMPPQLEPQIDALQEYLRAAGVVSLCAAGVEADDWIAGVTRKAVAAECAVVIASGDKDFMQLVGTRVGLVNPNDKTQKVWTAEDVRVKTGVWPGQLVDWLSLVGDSVDNIAGVPGIGPKKAAELLQQFGSLAELRGRLAEVTSTRLRQQLEASWETVLRNQGVVRLNADLELPGELAELEVRPPQTEQLRRLYARWGFNTLLAELDELRLL